MGQVLPMKRPPGRPMGDERRRLLDAVGAGVHGDCAALAQCAGVPVERARGVIYNLHRERVLRVVGEVPGMNRRRPRAVYAAAVAEDEPAWHGLAHVCLAWR